MAYMNIKEENRNKIINTTKEKVRRRRGKKNYHHLRPALSRGSRLDTTLTGLSRRGTLQQERECSKETEIAKYTSRKERRTHNIITTKGRIRTKEEIMPRDNFLKERSQRRANTTKERS